MEAKDVTAPSVISALSESSRCTSVTLYDVKIQQLFQKYVDVLNLLSDTMLFWCRDDQIILSVTDPEGWSMAQTTLSLGTKPPAVARMASMVKVKADDLSLHVRNGIRQKAALEFVVEQNGTQADLRMNLLHATPPYPVQATELVQSLTYRPRCYYHLAPENLIRGCDHYLAWALPAPELMRIISQMAVVSGTMGGLCQVLFDPTSHVLEWLLQNDQGHTSSVKIRSHEQAVDVPFIHEPAAPLSCTILLPLLKKFHGYLSQASGSVHAWLCNTGLLFQVQESPTCIWHLFLRDVSQVDWKSYT